MAEQLNSIIPNVMEKLPEFLTSIKETFIMVGWSGIISFILGLLLGVTITVTKPGNIMSNPVVYHAIDKVVNFFRSIPFIILLAGLVPLTRQIESALADVSPGLIEAAQSMGSGKLDIIMRVYLKESISGIARATTITIISLIGLTAMAGAIGAGGLGDFAIRFGHQRNQPDVTYTTVIVLVIIVSVIQLIGNYIARKNTHE